MINAVIEKQVSAESPRNVSEEKHSRYLEITCVYKWAEKKLNRLKAVLNANISHTEHSVHVEKAFELTDSLSL